MTKQHLCELEGKTQCLYWQARELPSTASSNISPCSPSSRRKGHSVVVFFSHMVSKGGEEGWITATRIPQALFGRKHKLTKKMYEEAQGASALALHLHRVFNEHLVNT